MTSISDFVGIRCFGWTSFCDYRLNHERQALTRGGFRLYQLSRTKDLVWQIIPKTEEDFVLKIRI